MPRDTAREHHTFDSSRVTEGWYDAQRREILLIFPDGVRWVYGDVTRATWIDLTAAASPGAFVNTVLTRKYPNRAA